MNNKNNKKQDKNFLKNQMNSQIDSGFVRIVNASDYADWDIPAQITRELALKLKDELETDLIEISINSQTNTSICKLIDKDKFIYQEKKREKERKANQKTAELKEIKLGIDIAENDFNTKLKQAIKFLEHGDNVKVSLQIKGRYKFAEFGKTRSEEVILSFADKLSEYGKIVSMPKWTNNRIMIQINSKHKK